MTMTFSRAGWRKPRAEVGPGAPLVLSVVGGMLMAAVHGKVKS